MASLTSQSIASSYEQLLHVDRDGGGNSTTLVNIKDGDNGTTFALQLATDKAQVNGALTIDADATDGTALTIDSEAQDGHGIYMDVSAQQDGYGMIINDVGSSRTTGGIIYINSNQNNSGTRNLVDIINNHEGATGATGLKIQQDSSSYAMHISNPTNTTNFGNGLMIAGLDENDTSYPLFIKTNSADADETAGNVRFAVRANGRVGIGGVPTTASLDIIRANDSAPHLSLQQSEGSGTTYNVLSDDAGNFSIREGSDTRFAINTSGGAIFYGEVNVANSAGNLTVKGTNTSAGNAFLGLTADNGATNADYWKLQAHGASDKSFSINNYSTGAYVSHLVLDANSRISLTNNDGGNSNTIFGYLAGDDITTNGNYNSLFGQQAGADITTGEKNTAIGYQTLFAHTDGDRNVAIGYGALMGMDGTESRNIGIGYLAGDSLNNNATVDNVFIGDSAGRAGTGEVVGCIGIGTGVMQSIGANNHTGTIGIGHNALGVLSSGGNNIAIGVFAGGKITTGTDNTLIGRQSGYQGTYGLTTGDHNTALGSNTFGASANAELTGNYNTAIGSNSMLEARSTAQSNTAVGYQTLQNLTDGDGNTAIGNQAMGNGAVSGDNNTTLGNGSGYNITSGHSNVIIGKDTNPSANTGQNQTVIGFNVTGNQNYGTVIGNKGMFQFVSKEYTAHQSDGEDLKSASGGEGLKLPAYSIIKSISVVVTQLSNLGTFDICLVLADESVGIGDNTAFTNPVEVLGARVAATLSGNSASAVNIALGSGAILKQSYHMDEAINVGATDKFLHLAQAGTGNGDTNPTTNALLNIMVEYIGLD